MITRDATDNPWLIVTHRIWLPDNSSGKVTSAELTPILCKQTAAGGQVNLELAVLDCSAQAVVSVRPNVRAKRATTAGQQARAGENVQSTTGPGLVACRWRSA